MKKIIYTVITLSMLLTACDNNTEDFNNNKDASYTVSPEVLFTNAEKALTDQMTTSSVNFSPFRFFTQYWSQTTYNDESRFSLTQRAVPDNHWDTMYRDVLGNLESAKTLVAAEAPSAERDNKLAIIEILQVYGFQVLVDSFGDVPYSEALNPQNKLPKYDDDAVIYPQLLERLNNAIEQLDTSSSSWTTDNIYGGDVAHWALFANSLKIKIGINLADVNATLSKTSVEAAYAAGVILTNADNATFKYPSGPPNYNPLFGDLVASGRIDFVAARTFVNPLKANNDPRLAVYFTPVPGTETYTGGVPGARNVPTSFSQIGTILKKADLPGVLMEATEVNFYLAEAAARGYAVGNNDAYYYNEGIRTSFEFWGLSAEQFSTYIAQPAVDYATAAGDWKEKIGTQAWYALYNRPFESWTSYRRLDYPVLAPPTNAVAAADGETPKRLYYPVRERTVNGTNYRNAVTAIGGSDRMKVHVFWDVATAPATKR